MERKRFDEVDVVRAFGIIAIIIIHILTYNLTNPIYKFLWNDLQFVVVAFVFCSGFVLSAIYSSFTSISATLFWYKKRFIRLIIPFWIYLVVHYGLAILFPNFFSGLGLQKTAEYFIKSAIFIGGTNFNWLPLLFLQLTFLFPIFTHWINKSKIIAAYAVGAIFITTIFSFAVFPYSNYRFVMWVPWSLVLLFAMYIARKAKEDTKEKITDGRYLFFGISFFIFFLCFTILNLDSGRSINFYDHKYPPDFYYLFFGISLTCFALLVARFKFWKNEKVKKIYFFISNNSYQIFFIHYILLDLILVLAKQNLMLKNPIIEFVIIFTGSIAVVTLLNKFQLKLKRK